MRLSQLAASVSSPAPRLTREDAGESGVFLAGDGDKPSFGPIDVHVVQSTSTYLFVTVCLSESMLSGSISTGLLAT